jgi:hypothetical protein
MSNVPDSFLSDSIEKTNCAHCTVVLASRHNTMQVFSGKWNKRVSPLFGQQDTHSFTPGAHAIFAVYGLDTCLSNGISGELEAVLSVSSLFLFGHGFAKEG